MALDVAAMARLVLRLRQARDEGVGVSLDAAETSLLVTVLADLAKGVKAQGLPPKG